GGGRGLSDFSDRHGLWGGLLGGPLPPCAAGEPVRELEAARRGRGFLSGPDPCRLVRQVNQFAGYKEDKRRRCSLRGPSLSHRTASPAAQGGRGRAQKRGKTFR